MLVDGHISCESLAAHAEKDKRRRQRLARGLHRRVAHPRSLRGEAGEGARVLEARDIRCRRWLRCPGWHRRACCKGAAAVVAPQQAWSAPRSAQEALRLAPRRSSRRASGCPRSEAGTHGRRTGAASKPSGEAVSGWVAPHKQRQDGAFCVLRPLYARLRASRTHTSVTFF